MGEVGKLRREKCKSILAAFQLGACLADRDGRILRWGLSGRAASLCFK